jgi:hypothetical protein
MQVPVADEAKRLKTREEIDAYLAATYGEPWQQMTEITTSLQRLATSTRLLSFCARHLTGAASVPIVFALQDSAAIKARHLIEFLDSNSGKINTRTFGAVTFSPPGRRMDALNQTYRRYITAYHAHLLAEKPAIAVPSPSAVVVEILELFGMFVAHMVEHELKYARHFESAHRSAVHTMTMPDSWWADLSLDLS